MVSKIAQITIIVITFVAAILKMADSTEEIILHWDFWGNITNYGPKPCIICLPIISAILFVVFLHYENNPYRMLRVNKMVVTPDNTTRLVRYIQVTAPLIMLIILYVTVCSAQLFDLQPLVIIATLLFIIVFYFYTCKKMQKKNI